MKLLGLLSDDDESTYRARSVRFSGSTRAIAHSAFDGMFYVFVSSLVAGGDTAYLLCRSAIIGAAYAYC